MTEWLIERSCLYRFYDVNDVLLYVGVTRDVSARFGAHRRDAAWWLEAARVEVTFHESMAAAEAAEAVAIVTERPLYNASQPSPSRVRTLHERAGASSETAVLRATAEVERLRRLSGDQYVQLVKLECENEWLRAALDVTSERLRAAVADARQADALLAQAVAARRLAEKAHAGAMN